MMFRFLLAASFLATATISSAAEHLHVDTKDDKQFRNAVGNFLNRHRPEVDGIHCMLSQGVDFHLFVKPANSVNRYRMEVIPTRNNSGWETEVSDLIDAGQGVPCAFNADSEVWMIKVE